MNFVNSSSRDLNEIFGWNVLVFSTKITNWNNEINATKTAHILTFGFLCGLFCFFGVREDFFLPAFIWLKLATVALNQFDERCSLENVLKFTTACICMYNIFPCFDRSFSLQWRLLIIIDLISGGQNWPPPLNTRQWSCYTLPILSTHCALHHLYPRAFYSLPSSTYIKRPRSQPVEHLQYHRKIRDCEQPY